jgi:secreted trypsin-like serine protease
VRHFVNFKQFNEIKLSFEFSASEGKANTIKFAFGQSNNFKTNKIAYSDAYRVSTYVSSKNTSADDLAVIYLESNVKTSKTIAVATPSTQTVADFFVGDNLVTCGFGDLDNFRNRTNQLYCTTLRVVPVAECAATAIPTTICTKNVGTSNVCGGNFQKLINLLIHLISNLFLGDFGAPAYTNSSGTLQVVGVVSFYPDSRPNTRCQDGHYAVLTQLGNFATFLASPKTVGTNLS